MKKTTNLEHVNCLQFAGQFFAGLCKELHRSIRCLVKMDVEYTCLEGLLGQSNPLNGAMNTLFSPASHAGSHGVPSHHGSRISALRRSRGDLPRAVRPPPHAAAARIDDVAAATCAAEGCGLRHRRGGRWWRTGPRVPRHVESAECGVARPIWFRRPARSRLKDDV